MKNHLFGVALAAVVFGGVAIVGQSGTPQTPAPDAQQPAEFRHDVRESKRILEDVIQAPVAGYRAASFSIGPRNAWAFEVLAA